MFAQQTRRFFGVVAFGRWNAVLAQTPLRDATALRTVGRITGCGYPHILISSTSCEGEREVKPRIAAETFLDERRRTGLSRCGTTVGTHTNVEPAGGEKYRRFRGTSKPIGPDEDNHDHQPDFRRLHS